MKRSQFVMAFGFVAFVTLTSIARAGDIVGPNSFVNKGNEDGSGTRANFDHTNPVTLTAGTYSMTNFKFEASQAGDALPVLATVSGGAAGSGTETYTIIAAGTDTTLASTGFAAGVNSVKENATFTVPLGGETVYAGFVNVNGLNAVDWQYIGSTTNSNIIGPGASAVDSHFDPGHSIATGNNPVLIGDQFIEKDGKGTASTSSNAAYEINRLYQFSVTITPEPSSFVLGGLGVMGLLVAARRRRKA